MQQVHPDRTSHISAPLSAAGEARRAAMLPTLQREVARRGVRRRIAQGAGVLVPAIGLAVVILLYVGRSHAPPAQHIAEAVPEIPPGIAAPPTPRQREHDAMLASAPLLSPEQIAAWSVIPRSPIPSPSIVRVASGDTSLVRRQTSASAPHVTRLSDDALASALRASGVDAGVVRTPTGVRIVTDRAPQPDTPAVPQSRASPARPMSPRHAATPPPA